jgi:hypothetical protein
MKNGLVLYLPFNGSFADSSGGGNTVTAVAGAALDYDMHGYAQSAFNSTGNGARLIVSNNGFYKVDTAFTISLDFMIRSTPYYYGGYDFSGLMCLASIVNNLDGTAPTFGMGMVMPALPTRFAFGVNSATSGCSSYGTSNPENVTDTTNFIPQPGSWYNMICIFYKGTASVYMNGQLIATKKGLLTSAMFCPSARFIVGGWWDGNLAVENINGKLDEIRFYNRPLNAKEIAWLSRNFQPGSTSTKVSPVLQIR